MKNLDRFYTTSDFDREYLRDETRYPKSERHVVENDSSCIRRSKSGELWSTIHKVVHVSLDPPKSTFSADYISTPRRCWPMKLLHALDFEKIVLAHTANRVGGPLKNFKGQHLKLGLKFYTCASITLGLYWHNLTKFYQRMWLIAGVITLTIILQGCPIQNLGG